MAVFQPFQKVLLKLLRLLRYLYSFEQSMTRVKKHCCNPIAVNTCFRRGNLGFCLKKVTHTATLSSRTSARPLCPCTVGICVKETLYVSLLSSLRRASVICCAPFRNTRADPFGARRACARIQFRGHHRQVRMPHCLFRHSTMCAFCSGLAQSLLVVLASIARLCVCA